VGVRALLFTGDISANMAESVFHERARRRDETTAGAVSGNSFNYGRVDRIAMGKIGDFLPGWYRKRNQRLDGIRLGMVVPCRTDVEIF
jgi:hypothetical protein